MSLLLGHTTLDSSNSPRQPVFVDNEIAPYAFDLHAPAVGLRGDVLNMSVLGIMILLGTSIWFLGDAFSTAGLIDLFCDVCGSGGCSKILKDKIAIAASVWLLGSMFFARCCYDLEYNPTRELADFDPTGLPLAQNHGLLRDGICQYKHVDMVNEHSERTDVAV